MYQSFEKLYYFIKRVTDMEQQNQHPVHKIYFWKFEDAQGGIRKRYIKSYFHEVRDLLPYHTHDFFEINIVWQGAGKHLIEQQEILTQKGDVFVIPPHVRHGYACKDSLTVYHILLSQNFMYAFAPYLEALPGYRMLFSIEPVLRSRIEKAYYLKQENVSFELLRQYIRLIGEDLPGVSADNEPQSALHVCSLIAALSGQMNVLRPMPVEELPEAHALTLIESMEYIAAHSAEKISFQQAAERCAISYSTYLRLFRKVAGVTPTEYQLNCRIENAARMLHGTNETILSIALSCGFYDSSHFIREFIREKGCSPSEYRKQMQM